MRFNINYFFLLVTFVFGAAGAATAVPFSDPAKSIMVSQAAPTFVIRLQSNPTTGYSWMIKQHDRQFIEKVSQKYIRPQVQMPGAGGYEEWTFKVKPAFFTNPAVTAITLVYARPWQRTSVKTVSFKITNH